MDSQKIYENIDPSPIDCAMQIIKSNKDFWIFHSSYWLFAALVLFLYGLTYGHIQVALVRNIYSPLVGFGCSYLMRAVYDQRMPAAFEKSLLLILLLSLLGALVSSFLVNPVTYGLLGYNLQNLGIGEMLKDGLYFALFYLVWSLLYLQLTGKSLAVTSGSSATLGTITVTRNHENFKLDPLNILCIKASGDYVEFVTEQGSYLKQGTISFYEQALNSGPFVRIHRSIIINAQKIQSISGPSKGQFWISLGQGHEVRSSRKYQEVTEGLTPQAP